MDGAVVGRGNNMPYNIHLWGDKDFNWELLDEAINFLCEELYINGNIECYGKEKYGQARIHVDWWDGCLYSLFNLQRVKKYSKIHTFEWKYLSPIWYKLFGSFIRKRQERAYFKAYEATCFKYPDLIEEFLATAQEPHLLMDLYIQFGLPAPWVSNKCEAGDHTPATKEYGDEKYCSECFKCISDLKDLGD